ncbi:MAG: tRNA(Ile)-lysidine synthase [Ignavibacteriaceae bacterium]|nr:tRNA(Ile)-lysidine synthase [Ignavibacteriaceae bacterium]
MLLHFLKKISNKYSLKLLAVHVNHQLRGEEAERDAAFCVDLCRDLGVEFRLERVNVKEEVVRGKSSVEMAARELRYQRLNAVLQEKKFTKIATGHNLDDNAETILLALVRGKGPEGLAGIPKKRGNIIRPLLDLKREEIENWLNYHKIDRVFDSTNDDLVYRRNFIRHKVIPLLNELNPSFANTVAGLGDTVRALIDRLPEKKFEIAERREGELVISIEKLADISDYRLFRELSIRLIENFNLNLKFQIFINFKKLVAGQAGRKINLGNGVIAFRERESIIIGKPVKKVVEPQVLEPGGVATFGDFTVLCTESDISELGRFYREKPESALKRLQVKKNTSELGSFHEEKPPSGLESLHGENPTSAWGKREKGVNEKQKGEKKQEGQEENSEFYKQPGKYLEFVDAEKTGDKFLVKNASSGDFFFPINGKSRKKISDFFNDHKIPAGEKWRRPLVFAGENVVWVCGLRLDERFKITEKTTKIYKLELKYNGQDNS